MPQPGLGLLKWQNIFFMIGDFFYFVTYLKYLLWTSSITSTVVGVWSAMLLALHCNFLRWSFFRGIKITSENVVSKRSPDTLLVEFKLSPKQPFNGKVGNRKLPRYLLWVYKSNVLSVNPLFSCESFKMNSWLNYSNH